MYSYKSYFSKYYIIVKMRMRRHHQESGLAFLTSTFHFILLHNLDPYAWVLLCGHLYNRSRTLEMWMDTAASI